MATKTNNLKLIKPAGSEKIDINVFNQNADAIDKAYEQLANRSDTNLAATASAAEQAAINRATLGYQRRNLLVNAAATQTINGVTFIVNDNKSITASGTATAFTSLNVGVRVPITDGEYIFSCVPEGGSDATYRAIIRAYDSSDAAVTDTLTDTGSGVKFTIPIGGYVNVLIRISAGTIVDNLTFKPMLRDARISDDTYVPHVPSVDERLTALIARVEALEAAAHAETETEEA